MIASFAGFMVAIRLCDRCRYSYQFTVIFPKNALSAPRDLYLQNGEGWFIINPSILYCPFG